MATGIKVQEYREDEVGGEAVASTAGVAIHDSMITGNPITQNGTLTGKIFHLTTVHYRNRSARHNVLRIYDGGGGVAAPADLRRIYFMITNQGAEIVDIRGVRFTNTTTGIWCIASTSVIFVHVGGVLRDN